jgi:hypothetical protein
VYFYRYISEKRTWRYNVKTIIKHLANVKDRRSRDNCYRPYFPWQTLGEVPPRCCCTGTCVFLSQQEGPISEVLCGGRVEGDTAIKLRSVSDDKITCIPYGDGFSYHLSPFFLSRSVWKRFLQRKRSVEWDQVVKANGHKGRHNVQESI